MKIIDADKLHYKQVYIQTEKGLRPALVVFAKEIRKMPAIPQIKVQVDPVKHGHWVEQENEDWKWSKEYRCSECGKYRLVTNPVGREWNYCPNCGAKMDEVEDGKID